MLTRPRQAVILAGGRGSRLGALTDTRPKPMIQLHGRPFLAYLLDQLREQGFTEVLLLLGYRADIVQDYAGDGRRFGVRVGYSVTPVEDLTVRRLQAARDLIEDPFLLMYCDNIWPLQMDRLWRQFEAAGVPALTTVYSNKDGYSRNTVRVAGDGFVEVFDRTRTAPGLNGIEISYAILRRHLLDLLPKDDMLVEEALYPRLARERLLVAHVTNHRYYSIGSPERLPLTAEFLTRRPAVLLDRDGVLNRRPEPGCYVTRIDQIEWLPGALEALRVLHEGGYRIIVVSNQAGVARRQLSRETLDAIHDAMRGHARAAGGWIDAFYCCPHDRDAGCDCRKPRPALLFQAQRDFSLDLTRTFFIGDDLRDMQAAEAAGAPGLLVTPSEPLLVHARQLLATTSSLCI